MNDSRWVSLSATWLSVFAIMIAFAVASDRSLRAADKRRPEQAKANPLVVPPAIRAEALRRGIGLANVKLQGENWIACEGANENAACVVLGRAVAPVAEPLSAPVKLTGLSPSTVLEVHQYGQAVRHLALAQSHEFGQIVRSASQGTTFEMKAGVEARVSVQGRQDQVIDTLPRYRREGTNVVRTKDYKLVRDYIDARPNEPFTVIVTVPALCEPCRRLDKLVHDNLQSISSGSTTAPGQGQLLTKLFVLEYFSFADAERELLGAGAVFPTTLVYGAETQPRKSISRLIGSLRGSSLDEISRSLSNRFRRGTPHTMSRGVVAQELLFQPVGQRLTRR